MTHNNKPNILVFRIGSLGDTLVALPSLHLLREQFPRSCITLLTNSPVDGGVKAASSYQILAGSGLIDKYLEYPYGLKKIKLLFKLVTEIRNLNANYVFYLMPPRTFSQRLRDTLFFLAAGIWRVHGLSFGQIGNTHRRSPDKISYESEASRLVRSIGFDEKLLSQHLFSLNLQKHERDVALAILGKLSMSRPFIALSIGAKVQAKNWGTDRWIELLQILSGIANQYALVFLGSRDEYETCQTLLASWPNDSLNLCGQLNPRQSAAVLEHATIFIGHDSGPMHLASSVGIPAVSIFAARNKPGIWFPFGNEDNVFYNNVPCSDCRLSVCIEKEMVCIRSIQPLVVATRIEKLLLNQAKNDIGMPTHQIVKTIEFVK